MSISTEHASLGPYAHIDTGLNDLLQALPETPEGYITPAQAEFLYAFVRLTQPRLVAETGFNVGHSACVILRAMETYGGGTLISFDIGKYDATHKAATMIQSKYANLHLIMGDTKQTLAPTLVQVLNANPDVALDLAIVDGGHDVETARTDLVVFESVLRPGGYLWLDDFENPVCVAVGVNIVGREFSATRPHGLRFATADHRGMAIFQKSF